MGFEAICGHGLLAERLWNDIRLKPARGYLFVGPQGVGKATVAGALAQALLCERAPGHGFCCTLAPCAAAEQAKASSAPVPSRQGGIRCQCCAGCVQAALRVHPDLVWVEKSADRTEILIEQVRDFIARLHTKALRRAAKVAVINDADTLGPAAQNALLKTLEEPPGGALIVLVAQDAGLLLDTVRSRLRPVRFPSLDTEQVAAALARRAGLDRAEAGALARLARGSLGRAMRMAEGRMPPVGALLEALSEAPRLDYAKARALAQQHFADREQAAEHFELIARLLKEIVSSKLAGSALPALDEESSALLALTAKQLDTPALLACAEAALRAADAVDRMANPRLQAEQWWMAVGQAAQEDK